MSALLPLIAALPLGNYTAPDVHPLPRPITDTDYRESDPEKVELGRLLFFDKLLSGNKNISCATCHHPELGLSDGVALGLGEGPRGLGRERAPGIRQSESVHERVPRNSPALFNLGAREFTTLFHDGRVEEDPNGYYEGGFITPAKWKLPKGLDSVLAAQAMFPVTSPTEMAGQQGENDIADAKAANNAAGPGGVWDILARRLRAVPEYVERFQAAYPGEIEGADDIRYVHAANAIAAFETEAFRADQSPFDRYLRGEDDLPAEAMRGMDLFYGRAGCSSCHSGSFQTDHDFHAIAMPQIGPGKADGKDSGYWDQTGMKAFPEDHGRGRVTYRPEDNFKFRTPSLRNVAVTGPWGHAGAYDSLEGVVRHHLDPVDALESFELADDALQPLDEVVELVASGSSLHEQPMSAARVERFLLRDRWVQSNRELRGKVASANELDPVELSDADVRYLVAFLESLTDPSWKELAREVPERVPSGLPVDD